MQPASRHIYNYAVGSLIILLTGAVVVLDHTLLASIPYPEIVEMVLTTLLMLALVGFVLRVTAEATRTEAALKAANDKYRAIVEDQTELIARWSPDGGIIFANEAACRFVGLPREALIGQSFLPMIPDEDRPRVEAVVRSLSIDKPIASVENRVRLPNGETRWVHWTNRAIFSETGKLIEYQSVGTDITERKQTEEALHLSEARFRALIEKSFDAVVLIDTEGRILYYSPSATRITGHSSEERMGRNAFETVHPDDLPQVQALLGQLMQQPHAPVSHTLRIRHKNGSECWVEAVASNLLKDPAVQAIVVNFHDVTQRKRIEDRFSKAFHSSPAAIALTRLNDGRIIDVNESFERTSEYTRGEIIGQSVLDLEGYASPEERIKIVEMLRRDGRVVGVELTARTKSGQAKQYLASMELIDLDGEASVLSHFIDITERKRAEEALRESEARLKETQRIARLGSWEWRAETDEEYWSEELCYVFGLFSCTGTITHNDFLNLVHPDDREAVARGNEDALHSGRPFDLDYRIILPSGEQRVIHSQAQVMVEEGRAVGLWGTAQDITEQKQAEQTLRQSESRLREAQRIARLGSWELELQTNVLHWSDEIYRIFEIDPAQFGATYEAFLNTIHPDDREAVNEAYTASVLNRTPYEITHRLLMTDGRIKHVHERCETRYDADGKPLISVGTVQDITERVLADQRLAESEGRLRAIFESEPECVKLVGHDGSLQEMNPAGLRMLEADSIEEVRRRKVYLLVAPEYREVYQSLIENTFRGNSGQLEFEITTLRGARKWLDSYCVPLRNSRGEIVSALSITRDVTERKISEEMLHNAHRRLQAQLREKEILLKEIHHRVKNNLQVISSLLYFQSKKIDSPAQMELFRESENRVASMALTHEMLYQSEDYSHICFGDYAQSLARTLFESYGADPQRIALSIAADGVTLDINSAIPCGLIINEAISNSLKHAFPNGRAGEIRIEMSRDPSDRFHLSLSDNGVGLPADVDRRAPTSLGLRLIDLLSRQLKGVAHRASSPKGTLYRITFPEHGQPL